MMSPLPGATARLAAMATALCDDRFLPIQHRLLAAEVLHRLRFEMPVSGDNSVSGVPAVCAAARDVYCRFGGIGAERDPEPSAASE